MGGGSLQQTVHTTYFLRLCFVTKRCAGFGGGGRQVGNRTRRLNVRIGLMCVLTVS